MNELTRALRYALCEPEIPESRIRPDMKVMYAECVPIGFINIGIVRVGEVVEGRLNEGLKGFRGILPDGENGRHMITLDHRMDLHAGFTDTILTCIYDIRANSAGPQECFVSYAEGVLEFEWTAPHIQEKEGIERHVIRDADTGVTLYAKKDPRTVRFGNPGSRIVPDENTVDFSFCPGKWYRVVQRIENGPAGRFKLPGFKQVPESVYETILDSISATRV